MVYNQLMKKYNWQQTDWPHFRYDLSLIHEKLLAIAEKNGLITGKMSHLNADLKMEALIHCMVEEAVKTSEIEGEYISRIDVRSSIRNQFGLNQKSMKVHDRRAQGVVELLMDVRATFQQSLTEEKLFDWHLMLLSGSFNPNLRVGYWRTDEEPMQVVSGHNERWVVHFEAPPSENIPYEMTQFIQWFNETAPGGVQAIPFAPVRSAIAHLYFESIHPFEDGNGRIGRAIAEKALSQGWGYPILFSLSEAIEADKKAYYAALNQASHSNEITAWLVYFVNLIVSAQSSMEKQINFILKKSVYFDRFEAQFNLRQLKVVRRMLQAGIAGFEGGMSAQKYMKITGTSKATATRDLQDLVTINAVKQSGEGRSVRYELNMEFDSLNKSNLPPSLI